MSKLKYHHLETILLIILFYLPSVVNCWWYLGYPYQVKASVQRAIKSQILESHPAIEPEILEDILPKKIPLVQYKVGSNLALYCRVPFLLEDGDDGSSNIRSTGQQPIFFQHRDGPILPTLRFVHQFPDLGWTSVTVDKGAIPFILGGANIMCPGLTNPGGVLPNLEANRGVIIMAEGKEHAIGVGTTKMSSEDIRSKNKGIGIEVAHYLGDGLFQTSLII